jgi:predicted AAA+ superfamily ATPase
MLYRKIYKQLENWKANKSKKALLVTGARRIGKTYLIRKFAESNYSNFIEINFITQPNAELIFSGNLNAETIIVGLTAYFRNPIVPGETLVFLDEIQECPNARTAIKFLVEDGRFDYIE